MSEIFKSYTAASASRFLDTIGINGVASAATASQMRYLGINHLRTNSVSASNLLAASTYGAKIDVIVPWFMRAISSTDIAHLIKQIDAAASTIEAVEGPNEVNHDPDSFNGLLGAAGIEAEQRQIYALIKADHALNTSTKTTSVFDFSVLQSTLPMTYGGMYSYADYNNIHAYGGAAAQPWWILPSVTKANTIAGDRPPIVTETGATTIADAKGVDQPTQARFDVDALLDDFKLGIPRTYLYDIQDWATGSAVNNFSAYYGLYTTGGAIKLAGTAIHDLTTILSGESNVGGTAASLSYSLSGLPYYGKSLLFSKGSGVFDLAFWNETADWNAGTRSEVAIPTNTVKLTLNNIFKTIAIYDPLQSSNPIKTVSNSNSITLSLNKDPLIVQLTPELTNSTVSAQPTAWPKPAFIASSATSSVPTVNASLTEAVSAMTGGGSVVMTEMAATMTARGALPAAETLSHSGTAAALLTVAIDKPDLISPPNE